MARTKLQTTSGGRVQFCGHDGWFPADIYVIEGAAVVRAVKKITPDNLVRPAEGTTHHVVDFPSPGFRRPDLGVLVVVPLSQLHVI